jgi:hypothetical protein
MLSTISSKCLQSRSDFIELLAIDDHVGIQNLPKAVFEDKPAMRDTNVFAAAGRAYQQVNLIQQDSKQKRDQTSGVILGADFDGLAGKVMAPRNRVAILILLTIEVASRGTCTPRLLATLLGCWIHVLLFRRVLLAIMHDIFKQGRGLPQDQVFTLTQQSRNELLMLAAVGPVAQSDLRVGYSKHLYCTDASPTGGAVIRAVVGSKVTQEIWRHSEQRGFYTKLQSPVSATLTELGLPSEVVEPIAPEPLHVPSPTPTRVLSEGGLYDCCELFQDSGNWSLIHSDQGLSCHDGFDIGGRCLQFSDLSSAKTCQQVLALVLRRVVSCAWPQL